MAARAEQPEVELFVVFSGRSDMGWQRLLRHGFRHCFALQRTAEGWILIDPLWGQLSVRPLKHPPSLDLPARWRAAGLAVLGPFRPLPPRPGILPLLSPITCVSVCQRLLGLSMPLVLTPWQLWRVLGRESWDLSVDPRNKNLTKESVQATNLLVKGRAMPGVSDQA